MNGNTIQEVIKVYLNNECTDYAILIDGVWGSGKSYFVENELSTFIQDMDCPYTETPQKFIPIAYSLYGAESTEKVQLDIRREIVLSAPNIKNKKKNLFSRFYHSKAESVISTVIGGVADYFGVDGKRLLSLFKLINIPKNIVLIFDDLERSKMSAKEVLGVVNQFAEREKIKVIVICNETKEDIDYKQFKEKTIRYSLHYSPSAEEKFDSIIKDLFKNRLPSYQSFVVSHKSLILDIFRLGECNNLRTLIFVLDIFEKIFNEISHCQFADEFNEGYLLFTCIYSIEYKFGASSSDLDWLACHITPYTTATIFDIAQSGYEQPNEKKNPFIEKLSRYGDYLKTSFSSKAIARYIQHGDLDKTTFEAEMKKEEEDYIEKRKTDYGQCLLKMMDWRKIDDFGLDELLSQVENFLKQDQYNPREISILYARYLALKINNILCRDIDDAVFFEAIDRQKVNWIPLLEGDLFEWKKKDNSYDSRYEMLKKYIVDIDKDFRASRRAERNEELMDLIRKGDTEGYRQYTNRIDIEQFLALPVDELWNAIINSQKDIQHLFVKQMMRLFPLGTDQPEKLAFIEHLLPHLQEVLTGKPFDFKMMKYKPLALQLQQILANNVGEGTNQM